jgi:bidirectional [NiFe] hydrogenase diaphorase subunit
MTARCVGACGLAPAVVLDGNVIGKLGTEQLIDRIEQEIAE